MSDYIKSIEDLPNDTVSTIQKVIVRYENSYESKQLFIDCYDRQLSYLKKPNKLPFNIAEVKKAFKAKNFFKDLEDCGSYLNFRHYKAHNAIKLHTANFCKRDKLCAPCAVRRAYKQQIKFMSIIENDKKLLDKNWYYIVIPVKHNKTESYETVMNRVNDLRKKLTQSMRDYRKGKHNNFWANFDGGMYSQEVTRSSNGWNVHLNLIINSPLFDVGERVRESCSRTSSNRGDIELKEVKNRRGQISYQNEDLRLWLMRHFNSQMHNISKIEDNTKLNDEIVEVLKYSLKFSSLSNQQLFEVFVKSRGVRLFGTFGNLWGKGLETVILEGDEKLTGEFEELIFLRTFGDLGLEYKLYRREMNKNDEEKIILDHTFGVCLQNLAQYNKTPLITISKGEGKFHIKQKGRLHINEKI